MATKEVSTSVSADRPNYQSYVNRGRTKRMNWKSTICHFRKFISSVNSTAEQEQMIRGTPFSWILDLPDSSFVRAQVQNMFDNWDHEEKNFIFHGKKLNFTKVDVGLILGLPDNGDIVRLDLNEASSALYMEFFRESDCSAKHLEKLIRKSRSNDKLYCQLFILYFFTTVLFCGSSSVLRIPVLSLIDCVDDFDNLARFNWCNAVYSFMAQQLDSIGLELTLRPKPQVADATPKAPLLKGFPNILAVSPITYIARYV